MCPVISTRRDPVIWALKGEHLCFLLHSVTFSLLFGEEVKKVHCPCHPRIIPDPKAVAEGQRVAAAVDLTGQAHAMPQLASALKAGVWPEGIDSDSQTLHGFDS